MKGKIFNRPHNKPLVLVAPLDWGLGHATRSIPIINALLAQGCGIIIAAEGSVKVLLEKEFPGLAFLPLRGYRIHYSRNKFWMSLVLLFQFPKVVFTAYGEHAWLKKAIKEHAIDAVISDSRLGLYNRTVPCAYIVHQLKIRTGNNFTGRLLQKFHYRFINRYTECWVPDTETGISLAGELSHPSTLPHVPVKYLGPLSRFERSETGIRYDLLVILSGPEPQRTIFEKMILKDLEAFKGSCLVVRGCPGETTTVAAGSAEVQNHLPAREMNFAILQSALVICRSGYTTVMDLCKLQKPAVLVPTPGQTEQEYLCEHLQQQGLFPAMEQRSFSLTGALKKAAEFPFKKPGFSEDGYEKVIADFTGSLTGDRIS
jgi:UDP:flavonoid glycosyltransferase YjiC (YdhE family)